MNKPLDLPIAFIDPDDLENNRSGNPSFQDVLDAGMKRRSVLRGGVGAAMATMFGTVGLTACGGGGSDSPTPPAPTETLLGFTAVAKNLDDDSTVPEGYTATTIFATGDPMAAGVAALRNDGTDTDWFNRSGDCHDGIQYFGLSAAGAPDAANGNDRGLLAMNHEYITPWILHAGGPSARPRPAGETDKEVACHGVSVIEVAKNSAGEFEFVQNSTFNRRLTGETAIEISGPVRGHPLLVTAFSTDGTRTRGSLNNCGNGKTPWGTLLTTEENWSGYYFRAAGDNALRTAKVNAIFSRYGRNAATTAASSRYGWETSGMDDKYRRWNTSVVGASTDGSDDYRNEWFGQGYMVEMDPYNPTSVIKKRSALGRFAHENGAFGLPVAGQPLAVYMGCDSQNEYVYKYVSTAVWDPADATAANRIATGDKYLDDGKLYAAVYNDDGTGTWVELSLDTPAVAAASFGFASEAEILIAARIAADAAGATRMDRPEWVDVHPTTGEIYITMTNNSSRARTNIDAANPRAYSDIREGTAVQNGNVNGHIVRMNEANSAATSFTWDIYLFGAEAGANPTRVNLSGLTDDQDFSSCDGLAFSASTGLCWIQTDDGAFTDVTNCMMLAAIPGQVGDGTMQTVSYTTGESVDTFVGARPTAATLKRFYVGPAECEVTGYCETPDGTVGFLNIQHPGDSTPSNFADASTYGSTWPANEGYGNGQRPRSATVMVTKDDGGRIGS